MKKSSILKLYSVVFITMFAGGILWSIINGYRYFCEGLQACDQSGQVLEWDDFWERKFLIFLWVGTVSAFITVMLLKDKVKGGKGSD